MFCAIFIFKFLTFCHFNIHAIFICKFLRSFIIFLELRFNIKYFLDLDYLIFKGLKLIPVNVLLIFGMSHILKFVVYVSFKSSYDLQIIF